MSYQLQIIEKPTYLHAIVTGTNSLENVAGYLRDLLRECEARQRFNVLIEERLTGRRLETWDVYQIASDNSALARGVFRAIAYVDVNAGGDLPGHLAAYDESVTFMTKDGPRPGVAPIEKAFRETYFRDGQAIQQLRFEGLAVRPLGPDAALATARWMLSGGGKAEQSGWFTLVWRRTAAGWRVVHDHSS